MALQAQPDKKEPALLVLQLLANDSADIKANSIKWLDGQSWESLAYWDPGTPKKTDHLFEAVPDVYRFEDGRFKVRFYRQDEGPANASGTFRIEGLKWIVFIDSGSRKELDRWKLLYLDQHYMAVDMDGLRVFFVPPDIDPF